MDLYNGTDLMQTKDMIFNVTAFPYFIDPLTPPNGMNYYGVQLRGMNFNMTTNSMEEIPLSPQHPYFNYSLVNFTASDFVGTGPPNFENSLFFNPFIPINGTLMIQWCAERLVDDYSMFINDASPYIT